MIVAITGSVLVALLDSPLDRRTGTRQWIATADIVFVTTFTIEFILRVIADGLLFTPNGYLKNSWNQLDFIVLIFFYVGVFYNPTESTGLPRAFRAARALRPMRILNYFSGMKEIFRTFFLGLPRIIDAALLIGILLIPWAIYGVNLFAGQMGSCNDSSILYRKDCIGEYFNSIGPAHNPTLFTIIQPRVWSTPFAFNFDSFGEAMVTLFQMGSTQGWEDVLYTAMGVSGVNIAVQNSIVNWGYSIFFVVYMLLGCLLGLCVYFVPISLIFIASVS